MKKIILTIASILMIISVNAQIQQLAVSYIIVTEFGRLDKSII